jgi:hypothetical protein
MTLEIITFCRYFYDSLNVQIIETHATFQINRDEKSKPKKAHDCRHPLQRSIAKFTIYIFYDYQHVHVEYISRQGLKIESTQLFGYQYFQTTKRVKFSM